MSEDSQGVFVHKDNYYKELEKFYKDYILRSNAIKINAIQKRQASLPCDLTSSIHDDRVVLVVWYKNDDTAIFSYDIRKTPKVWMNPTVSSRMSCFPNERAAELIISNVNEEDADFYKCRIEYSISRTTNHWVELQVIVPPQKLTIIDEKGQNVSVTVGPYGEGASLILTCVVYEGNPSSEIVWLRNDEPMESTKLNSGFSNVQTMKLAISKLTRSNLRDSYTCRASNNNLIPPLQKSIKVDINLGPIYVKIVTNTTLSAEKKYDVVCITNGSKPPAEMIWMIGNRRVDSHRFVFKKTDSADGNSSISVLSFSPTREEDGLLLTCRASNNFLAKDVEDSLKLNVSYLSKPTIKLGTSFETENIKEGQSVYFECEVYANPTYHKLIWLHNNRILQNDKKNGIVISGNNLILQRLTKYQKGNYSCVASNSEGEERSDIFNLKIMYKPVCRGNKPRVYGVARRDSAKVPCEVDSHPPPERFRWTFNNSAEVKVIPPKRISKSTNKYLSILTYKPMVVEDYGTILCWATNSAGEQLEPCVFHVVTAGKPDRPYNCTIMNASSYSLEIKCLEGFDGGLPQTARLEVYDQISSVLLSNTSSVFPSLFVEDLEAGKLLKIVIYAENPKGKSEPVVIEGYTQMTEKQSVLSMDVQSRLEIVPLLGAITGFIVILIILSLAALIIIKFKKCKFQTNLSLLSVDNSKINPIPEKRPNGRDFLEKDGNNPDIIPIYTNIPQLCSYNSSQHSTKKNIFTSITETFLIEKREQESYGLTYAELAPIQSNYLKNENLTLTKKEEDRVIYAEIEHDGRDVSRSKQFETGFIVSPGSSFTSGKLRNHQREVVTTKAPFLGYHQESCV